MLTCSKCETNNDDSAAFCMECGSSLSGDAGSGTIEAREQSVAAAPTTGRCAAQQPETQSSAHDAARTCPASSTAASGFG